ncbi:MAG TPA: hypothetical protein VEJ63_06465 [Planctomycetota bacterium]|nr:hypothetical protein [Planctomycetota bacterium]
MPDIENVSARYDREAPAWCRGWVVDLTLRNGARVTMPAAPQVYFADPATAPAQIEQATRLWLSRKNQRRVSSRLRQQAPV